MHLVPQYHQSIIFSGDFQLLRICALAVHLYHGYHTRGYVEFSVCYSCIQDAGSKNGNVALEGSFFLFECKLKFYSGFFCRHNIYLRVWHAVAPIAAYGCVFCRLVAAYIRGICTHQPCGVLDAPRFAFALQRGARLALRINICWKSQRRWCTRKSTLGSM